MKRLEHARWIGVMGLGFGALHLSACAVSTPATLTSTQQAPQVVTSLEMLSEADESTLRAQFLNELSNAFSARGVKIEKGAAFVADFSVSQRAVAIGLQEISDDSESGDAIKPAFRSRWYDECKPNRVSASLVIYARESGAIQTRSSGEFLACPGDLSQLSSLAQVLAESAIAN